MDERETTPGITGYFVQEKGDVLTYGRECDYRTDSFFEHSGITGYRNVVVREEEMVVPSNIKLLLHNTFPQRIATRSGNDEKYSKLPETAYDTNIEQPEESCIKESEKLVDALMQPFYRPYDFTAPEFLAMKRLREELTTPLIILGAKKYTRDYCDSPTFSYLLDVVVARLQSIDDGFIDRTLPEYNSVYYDGMVMWTVLTPIIIHMAQYAFDNHKEYAHCWICSELLDL
jgi:hypothetical protein